MIICPNPNCRATDHESSAIFCYRCGTSLYEMKCPICKKTDSRPGAKFCQECGMALELSPIEQDGPVAIDLGLPSGIKWASCNVGATKPEESGCYYAWGETDEKESYFWENYTHCRGDWCNCKFIGLKIAGTDYDAAHIVMGEKWEMPKIEQFKELNEKCDFEWTSLNGVNGGRFTGPNGNSIFLPFVGCRNGRSLNGTMWGFYWSGSIAYGRHDYYGAMFHFGKEGVLLKEDDKRLYRYIGCPVRAVTKE